MNLKKLALISLGLSPLNASISVETSPEPLNIALSSTFGSRSHVKYLFEIAQHLRNRGHNIIYAAPQGNFKFSKPYNYTEYDIGVCIDSARKSNIPLIEGFQGLLLGIGDAPFITNAIDYSPTTTESLKFYQRFEQAVIEPLKMIYYYYDFANKMNEVRRKFGVPQTSNPYGAFDQIMKISNTYIGFDEPRPISSTLKLVGPVMDNHIPPLNEELKTFLGSHKTMYVAFGSNVVLNERILKILMSSMQLAIDSGAVEAILWGLGNTNHEAFPKTYEVDGKTYSTKSILDGSHPYIKTLSWAPQIAILNHQNTKLFISHGGIESCQEAIHSGTPLLLMPIFGDQPINARLIKNRGIGDFVVALAATPYDLLEKIKELTREDNYILHDKIRHIQSISHERNSMRESNAKFIEQYAISAKICRKSHPPKPFEIPCELDPYMEASSRMSFIAAYKIDVILTLFSIGLVIVFTCLYAIYLLIKLLVQIPKQSKQKEE
ncbi:glycosyltransferase family 1 protein [Conidiobolus coronatus NRRL 28638]|uniref:Glycosyltransferase family 1 protein n=1 Tax=Conidiobolus coronatus (strain ATCC 28846 / CBS 209.66 / NRRL 28638) TaxID=796925 RepID=A0A137NUS9_CONC2|nr:glycosyltransferase family 1 protein [Conidiobolus coronatus NRRL 28638]|eukprot:KXN66507.1 glycosyltransferase family 1 protein [Conidiobolus coronatus NRRL 28638]